MNWDTLTTLFLFLLSSVALVPAAASRKQIRKSLHNEKQRNLQGAQLMPRAEGVEYHFHYEEGETEETTKKGARKKKKARKGGKYGYRAVRPGYTLPRACIEFTRMPEYDGPTGPYFENLPGPITDLNAINNYLGLIQANAKEINIQEVVWNETLRDRILNNTITDEDIISAFTLSSEDFMDELWDTGRTPTFSYEDMVSSLNIVGLGGDIYKRFPGVWQFRTFDTAAKVDMSEWSWPLHIYFWQGLDGTGHVLPDVAPQGAEDRYIVLPPYIYDDIPVIMFYYMGEGVVSKLKLWPGADIGWEINFPAYWPHGSATVNNYNVFSQYMSGSEDIYPWYDASDPNFGNTTKSFSDHIAQVNPGMNPDYNITIGRNPWIDPFGFDYESINGFVIGEHFHG